ncbi:Zonular occludens toxin (Zot) [compost metagenome]
MAVYFVTGKLGAGKSLAALDKIRERLSQGRRVATNLDLHLDGMFTECRTSAIRLPDKPRPSDMEALGSGYDSDNPRDYDESKFGLIVLDECGTWLNTREWNDKERRKLIDWFLHARKHRWDVMFLIQDIDSCDGQIVKSLCEHLVVCRRMDRFKLLGIKLPRMHFANVYYGRTTEVHVERWTYRGNDLFDAYDTGQIFREDVLYQDDGTAVDMRASYTMLSAWHLKGRYQEDAAPPVPLKARLLQLVLGVALAPVFFAWALLDPQWYKIACRRAHLQRQAEQLRKV